MIKLNNLNHCGIMPNYECSAACRHCLYACSPNRTEGYITDSNIKKVVNSLKKGNCRSVHIGGGEPFLNFDGLLNLVKTLTENNISVDYIETNASWVSSEEKVKRYTQALLKAGVNTFCISLDPYHAEFIPYGMPLELARLCRKHGFGFFIWQERFLSMLKHLDPARAYSRAELEQLIDKNYIHETALSYRIGYGGRAITIEEEYEKTRPIESLIDNRSCHRLLSTDHFHIDMYNRFIPPGCTGIAIDTDELLDGIPKDKYPAFEILLKNGVKGLYDYAVSKGFTPDSHYPSKCALCFYIRKYLSDYCPELPKEHYEESLFVES